MEVLVRAYQQAAELLRSMPPASRAAAVVAFVVAAVSLGYLASAERGEADAWLMGGQSFSAAQLRSMQAALGKAGVESHAEAGRLTVPRGQESKAMAALAESGALPVDFNGFLEKAVAPGGWMSLNRNQAAAMKIARQRELQNIINEMVEKSAVLIDEHADGGFPPKTRLTASVSILPRAGEVFDEDHVPAAIRNLMTSSVAGLEADAVTVIDLRSGRAYPGAADAASSGAIGDYAQAKRYHEREYQQTVRGALAYIPGAIVTTSVELGPVPNAGQPGVAPSPRRVAVSVAVPSSYYEQIWRRGRAGRHENAGAPDESALAAVQAAENRKIEQQIAPLLPRPPAGEGSVAISVFHQLAEPMAAEPALSLTMLNWLSRHADTLGLAALGAVALLVLRSIFKSLAAPAGVAAAHVADTAPPAAATLAAEPAHAGPGGPPRDRPRGASSEGLRDELAEVVREDPRAAVSILRTWIGNAG